MDATEEVVKVLESDRGWMSSDAIWNRTDIRHKDVCSDALSRLARNGAIQKRMSKLGHEYAALGVAGADDAVKPPPVTKLDPATHVADVPRAKPASAAIPTVAPKPIVTQADIGKPRVAVTPAAPAPVVPATTVEAAAKKPRPTLEDFEQQVLTALASGPMQRRDLMRLRMADSTLHRALTKLIHEGRIEKVQRGVGWPLYQLKTNTHSAIEPSAQPAVASNSGSSGDGAPAVTSTVETEPASPRDGLSDSERQALLDACARPDGPAVIIPPTSVLADEASFRCALWSDGQLEINAGDVNLVLPMSLTKRLCAYLDGVLMDGVTA